MVVRLFQVTWSPTSTGWMPKNGLMAIVGTMGAPSSAGSGAMQIPPVSAETTNMEMTGSHTGMALTDARSGPDQIRIRSRCRPVLITGLFNHQPSLNQLLITEKGRDIKIDN